MSNRKDIQSIDKIEFQSIYFIIFFFSVKKINSPHLFAQ